MISLEKFKEYKKVLEDNLTNKAFRSRMLFEAISDEQFSKNILQYMQKLEYHKNSEELNFLSLTVSHEIAIWQIS